MRSAPRSIRTARRRCQRAWAQAPHARPRRSEFADPQRRRALFGRGAWIVGGTFALTQWALIEAYAAGGQAGDVVLVAQLRLVLLVLVGVLLLGERDRWRLKLVASALMIAGVVLLGRA